MTHVKTISRQAPTKACLGLNLMLASLLPNWPATGLDVVNLLYHAFVTLPAAKMFGFNTAQI